MAQLRSGSLPLHIETGRYVGKKLEDRICPVCCMQQVESEYHFVFHCMKYTAEWEQFYLGVGRGNQESETEQIHSFFNRQPRKFSKFLHQIFNIRQKSLFK